MNRSKLKPPAIKISVTAMLLALGAAAPAFAAPKFTIEEATIDQIQAAILAKEVTTVQVVEMYLERIKAYNGTCVKQPNGVLGAGVETIPHAGQINALQTLNLRPGARKQWGFDDRKARSMTDGADTAAGMPDALEVAARQDAEFARTGKLVGPLHGVTLALKDQYDTFDMRSTSGADAFYADDRAPDDATFVARLRDAGAIILAKANLSEYANGGARSSFGGVFCNPYDTQRSPSNSSSGSGSSVATSMVTCAIAEETGSSIRGPARANNAVGIAPTQELISRDGMIQPGINTRVGPICRTVQDAAKILTAYAGYDPKDELTVFSVGRKPPMPYEAYATETWLDGVRIGVVRELFTKANLTPASYQTVDLVSAALASLASVGAQIVDPGEGGALLASCVRKYAPKIGGHLFTKMYPELFPVDTDGKPVGDHIATLVALVMDPSKVPEGFGFMSLPRGTAEGESKFSMNLYLAERGDAVIKTNTDLVEKANWLSDPNYPDFKSTRVTQDKQMFLDMSDRMLDRFQVQTVMLQCMEELDLDAMAYPTSNTPPEMLGSPEGGGRGGRGRTSSSSLGRQGFPAITVPAGFTTEMYDRVIDADAPKDEEGDPGTKLVGPVAARLPVGIDFVGRPFDEPTLLKIASAYEAKTHHRTPPAEFGPLKGEP
jgi:Asp-tRNA(Asn)/Glu-tRNA(Gln) amidotransferase A subunit family amidase